MEDKPEPITLNQSQRTKNIIIVILKIIGLLALLYFFICSLELLSDGFRLLGGRAAGTIFQDSSVLSNPIAGLIIGILATVLVQSSSTSTSIVVSMVDSGILTVEHSVPIIMGANIGTSVTNTLVSLVHSHDRVEFERAFAGATVHDMFNWLCVILLLPVEIITKAIFGKGYLVTLSSAVVGQHSINETLSVSNQQFLKVITKPLTKSIMRLDKKIIAAIAHGENVTGTVAKHVCVVENGTRKCEYNYLLDVDTTDAALGGILLVMSLICLCLCLMFIVKLLNSMLRGTAARVIKKTMNADFHYPFGWMTSYFAIVVGMVMTFLVQSSSVFTSTLTPLVGIGVLTLERVYPLTLGSNIGTTGTALLAAVASRSMYNPLRIALCHFFFNITGIMLWYVIPNTCDCIGRSLAGPGTNKMRQVASKIMLGIGKIWKLPLILARHLGRITAQYRWFAVAYLLVMFFLFPLVILSLSIAGWYVLVGVVAPFLLLGIVIVVITLVQKHAHQCLPKKLATWEFVPLALRSLKPYDKIFIYIGSTMKQLFPCCRSCRATNVVSPLASPKQSIVEYQRTTV